jgi:hypothetical protein
MVGGGGGGQGSRTGDWAVASTAGASSTFGGLLVAPGGLAGFIYATSSGTAPTITSPASGLGIAGGSGTGGNIKPANSDWPSGCGGSSYFGGAGGGQIGLLTGFSSATPNTGGGGGGGAGDPVVSLHQGAGGGAGGYIDAVISSPAASYAYAVGTGGAGGAAGASGFAGGAGGSGVIIVFAYFA